MFIPQEVVSDQINIINNSPLDKNPNSLGQSCSKSTVITPRNSRNQIITLKDFLPILNFFKESKNDYSAELKTVQEMQCFPQ